MDRFAQRLTLLRESKELKKKDLATILNVSAACVSQYENGLNMPGYDILRCLSNYFGVSIDFLLGNENDSAKFELDGVYTGDMTLISLLNECNKVPMHKREAVVVLIKALQEPSEE